MIFHYFSILENIATQKILLPIHFVFACLWEANCAFCAFAKRFDISTSYTEHDLKVASYVHLFDSCAQDWYAVLSIVTHLLKTAKATKPQITKAYLRSDEAGCYHNNNLIASVSEIGKHVGIRILR